MRVFRIAHNKYIKDMSGEGARINGGRWNPPDTPMLYFSEHLSLALLELLANHSWLLIGTNYSFIEIDLPDKLSILQLNPEDISPQWRNPVYISQTIQLGNSWIYDKASVVLKVPSAVLPEESNFLINPRHELFSDVKIVSVTALNLDKRLTS